MRPDAPSRSAFAHPTPYNDRMTKNDDEAQARGILRRVESDQLSMIGQEARGAQIDESDPVEVWAKRIGRIIGYGLLVVLIVNLFTGWFF